MSNTLSDLNAHLFEQMARLSKADMTPEQIESEVKRTGAMVSVANQVTNNADLQLKAAKLYAEHGAHVLDMLPQIGKASS